MKEAAKGLCVPGYMHPTPDNTGWLYSAAMVAVLEEYRQKHGWVLDALDAKAGSAEPSACVCGGGRGLWPGGGGRGRRHAALGGRGGEGSGRPGGG